MFYRMDKVKKDAFLGIKLPGSLKDRVFAASHKTGYSVTSIVTNAIILWLERNADGGEIDLKKSTKKPRKSSAASSGH